MKKILLSIVILSLSVACVDDSYNLSDIDTDDITIGNDNSELLMPLADISLSVKDFESKDGVSIYDLYQETNIWLPNTLPQSAEYVDVVKITTDDGYLQLLLRALYDEMRVSQQKCEAVFGLIVQKYRTAFLRELMPFVDESVIQEINEASDEQAKIMIIALFQNDELQLVIESVIEQLAGDHLTALDLEDAVFDLGSLGLSSDVEDMLTENLAAKEDPTSNKALYLYGTISSELPFDAILQPFFEHTDVRLGVLEVSTTPSNIEETRIYAEDMRIICDGATLILPVQILRYYPKKPFSMDKKIYISLKLKKTGGLVL